jgi:uncharacterized membrane protein
MPVIKRAEDAKLPGAELAETAVQFAKRTARLPAHEIAVRQSVTINASVERLIDLLCQPEVLDQIVGDAAELTAVRPAYTTWRVSSVAGAEPVQLDLQLERGETALIWRTLASEGSPEHEALVRFTPAPQERGTEVALRLTIKPPKPLPAKALRLAAGGAALKVLHRAKSFVETGEMPTLHHNPAARNGGADHDEEQG